MAKIGVSEKCLKRLHFDLNLPYLAMKGSNSVQFLMQTFCSKIGCHVACAILTGKRDIWSKDILLLLHSPQLDLSTQPELMCFTWNWPSYSHFKLEIFEIFSFPISNGCYFINFIWNTSVLVVWIDLNVLNLKQGGGNFWLEVVFSSKNCASDMRSDFRAESSHQKLSVLPLKDGKS